MIFTRTTYTSSSLRGGHNYAENRKAWRTKNAENRHPWRTIRPGVRTRNSKSLTEALLGVRSATDLALLAFLASVDHGSRRQQILSHSSCILVYVTLQVHQQSSVRSMRGRVSHTCHVPFHLSVHRNHGTGNLKLKFDSVMSAAQSSPASCGCITSFHRLRIRDFCGKKNH